jgi:hypothetical protein
MVKKYISYTVYTKTVLGDTDENTFPLYIDARKYFELMADDKDMSFVAMYDRNDRLLLRWDCD